MNLELPTSSLGRIYDFLPRFLRPMEFRVVESVDELTKASHLVYREYLKRNYIKPYTTQLKLSIYHALPSTAAFIAVKHRKIVGTVSVIEASPLGLPMDEVYKLELDALRKQGRNLAEISMLALDSEEFSNRAFTMFNPRKLLVTLRLFRVMFDYLRSSTKVHDLVACFNPKHQILYDFLQLKPLGGVKSYSGANGNPAVARFLNVNATQQEAKAHAAYKFFYGKIPSARPFAKRLRLTPDEMQWLFVLHSSVFGSASSEEMEQVKGCYPTYDFERILRGAVSPAAGRVQPAV